MAAWLINYLSIPVWNYFVKNKKIFVSIMSIQLFLLMIFFEETLRVDYTGYCNGYNEISGYSFTEMLSKIRLFGYPQIASLKCESGWMILNWIVGKLGFDFQGFLILHSLFCVSATGIFIYRYSDKPWLSFALFVALGFYKFSFGILRQSMAICIMMYAMPYINEKKPVKFVALLATIFLIHRASIIYVMLYLFSYIKINKKIFVGYYALSVLGLICSPLLIESVLIPFLEVVNYAFYVPEQWQLNFQILIVYALPVALFFTINFDVFFEKKTHNLICWGFLLTIPIQIFSAVNDMFGRLAFGFYIFIILLLAADLEAYENKKISMLGICAIYILGAFFYMYTMAGTSYVPYILTFQ